jgi:hypothetical protein
MKTINKHVAVEPFPRNSAVVTTHRGQAQIQQRAALTGLKVVFDTDDGVYRAGDVLFFRGDTCKTPPAMQLLSEGDVSFILLPVEWAVGVNRVETKSKVVLSGSLPHHKTYEEILAMLTKKYEPPVVDVDGYPFDKQLDEDK